MLKRPFANYGAKKAGAYLQISHRKILRISQEKSGVVRLERRKRGPLVNLCAVPETP